MPATFLFVQGRDALLRLLCVSVLMLLSGCSTTEPNPRLQRFQYASPHMGTTFSITLYAESKLQAEEATQAAFDRVAELEDILSDYMADSELMQLAQAQPGTPVDTSEDLFNVLQRGTEIAELTGGAFDLTAGPFTRLWRFSRKQATLPSETDLAAARTVVGWEKLLLDTNALTATLTVEGMRLDAGGIAKGYAAGEAMQVLESHGITRALVAAGGDILTSLPPPGTEGWEVAVAGTGGSTAGPHVSGWVGSSVGVGTGRSPRYRGSSVGLSVGGTARPVGVDDAPQILLVRNAAVSTSGDTEQFIEIDGVRYSHIVSPLTGLGLTNRIQVTVIAPNATTSDALATACCVLGAQQAIKLADSIPNVSAIVLTRNDDEPRIWRSKNAP